MRILLFWFILALVQPTTPDYAITNLRIPVLSEDGDVIVAFDVVNNGSAASVNATVRMVNKASGQQIATEIVRPLLAGDGVTVILNFPADTLPEDEPQTMLVSVGIDEVEPSTGNIANNMVNVDLPQLTDIESQAEQTPEPGAENGSSQLLDIAGFRFNTADPVHIAALVGISGALLIMLLLLIIILRLLVRRQPKFEVLPPPYANLPPQSPSTNTGRRQGWQIHAQSDLPPPTPANEGATHIRKLLIGIDGAALANWKITGLRLSQYDQYGRVSRSEIIAKRGVGRKLTNIAAKAEQQTDEQLERRLRSLSDALAKQFARKIDKRNAMLPIALDLSFQGVHGEVRILFELFYMEQGRWKKVDTWEPEMTVIGKNIHESFTYSLNGLYAGEVFKTFPGRLQEDIASALANMLKHNQYLTPARTDTWSAYRPPAPSVPDDPLAKG